MRDADERYRRRWGGQLFGYRSTLRWSTFRLSNTLGSDAQATARLTELRDRADQAGLRFQLTKAELFHGLLNGLEGGDASCELATACAQLLRLGHVDFLGQELMAAPEALRALLDSGVDDAARAGVLAAVATQAGGPSLISDLASPGDLAPLLTADPPRLQISDRQRARLLHQLRGHPSEQVRRQARRRGARTGELRLFPELTKREEEVLAVLAEGQSNEQIAERLFLTVPTVKTHVHRILKKTGSQGRLAAALLYRERSGTPAG